MIKYGVPYQGGKNSIARWIIEQMPSADCFVDLFSGGCGITHAALLSGKYKRIIANDINPLPGKLFRMAINGELKDAERRWISREEFMRLKDTDPVAKYVYSFGNDGRSYMYAPKVEAFKKALHSAIVLKEYGLIREYIPQFDPALMDTCETVHERRLMWRKYCRQYAEAGIMHKDGSHFSMQLQSLESLQSLQSLERLERLESLQSLQSLQNLESLEMYSGDYRDVAIPEGAVVYCDIPYRGSKNYGVDFDYEAFYAWAKQRPCYISEYSMPEEFRCIAEIDKQSTMCAKSSFTVKERLFVSPVTKATTVEQLQFDLGGKT